MRREGKGFLNCVINTNQYYEGPYGIKGYSKYKANARPLVCTKYMTRTRNSRFYNFSINKKNVAHLPMVANPLNGFMIFSIKMLPLTAMRK